MNPSASRIASRFLTRQAGSISFEAFSRIPDVMQAFQKAHAQAVREYGKDGYSGTIAEKSGFAVRTRTPMTLEEARRFINKDIDNNDKRDPAYAIPIGNKKPGKEKKFRVTVEAKSESAAILKVKTHLLTTEKPSNANIEFRGVKATVARAGKAPKLETRNLNETYFFVADRDGKPEYRLVPNKFKSRDDALKALTALVHKDPSAASQNASWTVVQISKHLKIAPSAGNTGVMPTWTVEGIMVESPENEIIGWLFYGMASR